MTLMKRTARVFDREAKNERRTFCPCELCRIRWGRMLYNRKRSGEPLRSYVPGGQRRAWRRWVERGATP